MSVKPVLSSNFSFLEFQIPKAWNDLWVEDPIFGDESFFDVEKALLEENPICRRRALCFCPATGRREDLPYVTELQWEAAVRKRGVTVGNNRRARIKTIREDKRKTRAFLERERLLVAQKQEKEISRGIVFYLNQCAFIRKQVHMLDQVGENSAGAQKQLRSHQEELLRLRAARQAA